MNGYIIGGVIFVVVFVGLGVALVFLLFTGRTRSATADGIPVDVGGVTVHVGG